MVVLYILFSRLSPPSIFLSRNFDKPIVTMNQASRVLHLQWCPNRPGLLCSASEASDGLTLHDIQSWTSTAEQEPAVTERTVKSWISSVRNTEKAEFSEGDRSPNEFGGRDSTLVTVCCDCLR